MSFIESIEFIQEKENNIKKYELKDNLTLFYAENSKGKTVLLNCLDYLLGCSDDKLKKEDGLKNVDFISLTINKDGNKELFKRCINNNKCYWTTEVQKYEKIELDEYKKKLENVYKLKYDNQSLFNKDYTFRMYTFFNFLEDQNQGTDEYLFTKQSTRKYMFSVNDVIDIILNPKIDKIKENNKNINHLNDKMKKYKEYIQQYNFYESIIEENKKIYGSELPNDYEKMVEVLDENFNQKRNNNNNNNNIIDLQKKLNYIQENIKQYKQHCKDLKTYDDFYENKKKTLRILNDLIKKNSNNENYISLLKIIEKKINSIDKTQKLSSFIINKETLDKLSKNETKIKNDIQKSEANLKNFSLIERDTARQLLKKSLDIILSINKDSEYSSFKSLNDTLDNLKKEKKELEKNNKELKKEKDIDLINILNEDINTLYFSAAEKSDVIKSDISNYKLTYDKKSNFIFLLLKDSNTEYIKGSSARRVLIQLCGYLAFLKLIIDTQPVLPILCIDNISNHLDKNHKSCDEKNKGCIEVILNKFFEIIGKSRIQIILLDKSISTMEDATIHKLDDGLIPWYVK